MSLSLRSLSDSDLLSRTRTLADRERALTLSSLIHLNEIEQRKLHLKQGYSSMFDYCTTGLGYSEPAAVRRIRTARCVARFPEVHGLLEANDVNLSTIARVSRVLTAENRAALLERIRGRSQRAVEAIVAEYEPRARLRDVVRPVVVRTPVSAGVPTAAATPEALGSAASAPSGDSSASAGAVPTHGSASNNACENSDYRRSEGDFHPTFCLATETRVQFQFAASQAFREKLERVKSLAWHRLPANPSLEEVFDLALDAFIEKHDPCARRERRERRQERAAAQVETNSEKTAQQAVGASRYIAAAVRDDVFSRDVGRCSFVSSNGRRCAAKNALQIDHIKPFARGGASTLDNLRLLCAYHNRLEAERLMGPLARMSTRLRE